MLKKSLILIVLLFLLFVSNYAAVAATFPDLMRPYRIMVDDGKLYVLQEQNIFIYSIADYKLLKKFGQKGEGPMEFMGRLNITAYTDYIIVNSQGKITYWTKMGEFIKEIKCPFAGGVETLGDNMYVGNGFIRGNSRDKTNYNTIVLYDSNFNKIRIIDKKKSTFQRKWITFFGQNYYFINSRTEKWIYVIGHDGMVINVFNDKGEKLFTIKEPYEKLKVTDEDMKGVRDFFKSEPRRLGWYEENKHRFKFEEYKPAIKNFLEYDKLIYVETWNRKGDKTEFYIFGQDGKLKKRVFLPLVMIDWQRSYPYFVDSGKFYQLVENEDEEIWELHVTDVGL
jgi:hypothetical protein